MRQQLKEAAGDVLPVALPANEHRITNLPQRRVREFRDHLQQIIGQATSKRYQGNKPDRSAGASTSTVPQSNTANQLIAAACATCKGRCCLEGGCHAYLTPSAVDRYLDCHPQARPRDVLQAYLERLPSRSYENACVYHTETGCALPPEMRADECGRYLCEPLAELIDSDSRGPVNKLYLVSVAADNRHVCGATLVQSR